MVGDGVNDARALKRAQVGVAMRSGSSVTRDVADIVLLDDSFATLPPARTEGRRIIAGVGSSMYLFLSRVATQMLVILTVTLLGLGFPYTPTQVGLTLFTVGVPTFFLTLWARPKPPDDDLLASLARFVIPVGVLTAGFATAIYAYLYRQIADGFTGTPFPQAITLFEQYTGLTYGVDADFVEASATLGAQSAMSVFVSSTAIVLILLLEPPHRIFTAWAPVSSDRRPTWLALGLFAAFAVVLVVPATREYFGLTAPDPPVAGDSRDRPGAVVRHAERRAAVPGARTRPRPPPATGPDGPGHSLTGRALPRSGAFSVQAVLAWRPRRDLDHHRGCRVQSVSDGRPSVLVRYTPSGPEYGPGGGSGGPRPCGTCTGVLTRATPTASTRSTVGARPAPTAGPVVVGARAARRRRAARSSTSGATPPTRPRPPTSPSRCVSVAADRAATARAADLDADMSPSPSPIPAPRPAGRSRAPSRPTRVPTAGWSCPARRPRRSPRSSGGSPATGRCPTSRSGPPGGSSPTSPTPRAGTTAETSTGTAPTPRSPSDRDPEVLAAR